MRLLKLYIILIAFTQTIHSQIINKGQSNSPNGTFEVKSSGNSAWYDGIIFPKVSALTVNHSIYPGLLTFFNSNNYSQAGIYYFNENIWHKFYSANMLNKDMSVAVYQVENGFYNFGNANNTAVAINLSSSDRTALRVKLKNNNDVIANHPDNIADRIFSVDTNGNLIFPKIGKYLVNVNLVIEIKGRTSSNDSRFRNGIELALYKGSDITNISSAASSANFFAEFVSGVERTTNLNIALAGVVNVTTINEVYPIKGFFRRLEDDSDFTAYSFSVLGNQSNVTVTKLK